MSDKKNVLSDKQKHQLNKWLEANKDAGFNRTIAAEWASREIGFTVTYSNMKSAEEATGISLVKVKEPKAGNDESRISNLETEMLSVQYHLAEFAQRMDSFKEWCKAPVNEKLAEAYIKQSTNKPIFCQKHR